MSIWAQCHGHEHIRPLNVSPWRVVEAQHVLSSRDLVNTPEEHDVLETLLEHSKPWINPEKDYLIFTPFRYPPLQYGSRFGRSVEPSLWYGSMMLETAFAEVAYYRGMFFQDTEADLGYIDLMLTAFRAVIKTKQGIDLTEPPFETHRETLSSKLSYESTQNFGSSMRSAGVEAFVFYSARTLEASKNVGVFMPSVFVKTKNQYTFDHQTWQCMANKAGVEFVRQELAGHVRYYFPGL